MHLFCNQTFQQLNGKVLFLHLRDFLQEFRIKQREILFLAHWVNQTNYSGAYAIWQYSSKGKVAGINGNVDLDICYKDFLTVIKNKGLNGWAKSSTPAPDVLDTATVTITIGNDTYKGTLVKA